jgi:hypothetical protein
VTVEMPTMHNAQPTRRFRLRFTVKQLFLAVALVAVGLAIWKWVFRNEVVVRAATAEDKFIGDGGFKFKFIGDRSFSSQRKAAVVTGRFTESTSLSLTLHLMQAGKAVQLPTDVFGRKVTNAKSPFRKNVGLKLSLVETTTSPGNSTLLMTTWTENGDEPNTQFSAVEHNFNVVATKTLPGTITPGRPHIIYVEGDRQIVVDGKMTVEEFARANSGNYLVVTVEVDDQGQMAR